jgi:hypothetical protein
MKRSILKEVIRKIVLNEITMNTVIGGTTDNSEDPEGVKVAKKAVGTDGEAYKPSGSSNVAGQSGSGDHQVKLYRKSDNNYNVVSITNGSDRRTAKSLKLEEVSEFLKKHVDETKVGYVEKARDKSLDSYGSKKADVADKKTVGVKVSDTDKMEEVGKDTQKKISDKNDKKAGEKFVKEIAPVSDEIAPQLGGELVDKIESIIDRVLKGKNFELPKDKAEPKSAFLKADKDKESSDKLAVKLKDTPALKIKKSEDTPSSKAIDNKKK